MMNSDTELFELCKAVHRHTGWFRGLDWLVKVNEGLDSEYLSRKPYDEDDVYGFTYEMAEFGDNSTPLYTSDYLLEKLPPYIRRKNESMEHRIKFAFKLRMSTKNSGNWRAGYYNSPSKQHLRGLNIETDGDTPLKALLKLTIALSEAGVKL